VNKHGEGGRSRSRTETPANDDSNTKHRIKQNGTEMSQNRSTPSNTRARLKGRERHSQAGGILEHEKGVELDADVDCHTGTRNATEADLDLRVVCVSALMLYRITATYVPSRLDLTFAPLPVFSKILLPLRLSLGVMSSSAVSSSEIIVPANSIWCTTEPWMCAPPFFWTCTTSPVAESHQSQELACGRFKILI